MNIIIKIGVISLIYIISALLLKSYRPEFVFLLRVFCVVFVISLVSGYISSFLSDLLSIFTVFNIESIHISLLFKVVAITIISDLISDSLNDAGEATVSNIVVLISKFIILFMTMPLINSLIIFCLKLIE
ncbi:MAG: hypothetical protein J6B37_08705 [Clostridia bacterium]|nr:hypothetical protein [Clostridia bacterium]